MFFSLNSTFNWRKGAQKTKVIILYPGSVFGFRPLQNIYELLFWGPEIPMVFPSPQRAVFPSSQLMVFNCWFGARWFGFRKDPLMKGIGNLGCTPIRIPNHRAPNQQLTISWPSMKKITPHNRFNCMVDHLRKNKKNDIPPKKVST